MGMNKIMEILDSMDYGPAPEDSSIARDWLAKHQDGFGHFIDGAFTRPATLFEVTNPATGQVIARVSQGGAADVDAAVKAARAAQGKWAALPGHDRARHLYALARHIQQHARLLAVLETLDNGKPIRESRDIDIPLVIRHFYHHAGWAELIADEFPGALPHGVCGQVIPWNFPLLMLAWKVAPALAAGNTVVLKPAEYTPLTALALAEIAREAGLPKGVLNIVTGDGQTGAAITGHAGIDKVAFTGSTEVGRIIRRQIAGSGKALTLELGGKSPAIIAPDYPLATAAARLGMGKLLNAGQTCIAPDYVLISPERRDAFVAALRAYVTQAYPALRDSADYTSIVNARQYERLAGLVEEARARGATVVTLPDAAASDPARRVFAPTLVLDAPEDTRVMQEEIFGPILPIVAVKDVDAAIAYVNARPRPLALYHFDLDAARTRRVLDACVAGGVSVNDCILHNAQSELPFGGVGPAGMGHYHGHHGFLTFSKQMPVFRQSRLSSMALMRPPYGKLADFLVKFLTR